MKILITLPIYNEEKILEQSVRTLYDFCAACLKDEFLILIADNGSRDGSVEIGRRLAAENSRIRISSISARGRGNALREIWLRYADEFDVFSYTDIDLAADIRVLPKLIELASGEYDITIGSRYAAGAKFKRSVFRWLISKFYNWVVKVLFTAKIKDFQCGFKAVNQRTVKNIISKTKDARWFFDTEFLLLAEREGYKIKEMAVDWVDSRFSRRTSKVKIIRDVYYYFVSLAKFWFSLPGKLESIGVAAMLFFCAAILLFLQFSGFTANIVSDPDTFYHLKMAELTREQGVIKDFPWLQFTVFQGNYIDHHFLFHVFLIPFISVFPSFIGVKIATVVSALLLIFVFNLILKELKVSGRWFWILLFLLGSVSFLFRLNLGRAQNFSLLFLLLGVYWLIKKPKFVWLFPLSFFYVWLFDGFILMPLMAGIFCAADFLSKKKIQSFKPFFQVVAGMIGGIVVNPYFPTNLPFYKVHLWEIPFSSSVVRKGNEWNSILANTPGFLRDNSVLLLFWLVSVVFTIFIFTKDRRKDLADKKLLYGFLLLSLFFFAFTLKSQRFIEYFVPFAVLFIAAAFSYAKSYGLFSYSWIIAIPNVFKIGCAGVLVSVWIMLNFLLSVENATMGWSNDGYKVGALWLRENTPADSTVFNMDWDDFPELFYYNSRNYYIVGMDPTFMYGYDQELYWLWYHITQEWKVCGRQQCDGMDGGELLPVDIIKERFNSQYIFLEKSHSLNKVLNKELKKVFEDNQAVIFEL